MRLSSTTLTRIVAFSLCLGATSLIWDAWWHVALGRDSLWEPPHYLLYVSVASATFFSVYVWIKTKETTWRNVAVATLFVPLSAPFDDLWHRFFGVENLNTILIVWSPPHIAFFAALILSLAITIPHLRKDKDPISFFIENFAFGCILGLTVLITVPLFPFGPYNILGFWGAGFIAFFVVIILMAAAECRQYIASFTAIFAVALYFLQEATVPGYAVKIPSYYHPPGFTIFFSTLLPALLIDAKTLSCWLERVWNLFFGHALEGGAAGLLYGMILYGFTSRFMPTGFQYPVEDAVLAVVSCALGGLAAGIVFSVFSNLEFAKEKR